MVADSPALHASPLRAHAKHVWAVPEPADWSQPMEEIASRLGARDWRGLANRSGTVEFLGPARVRRGGPRSPSSSGILLTYRHLLMEKLVDLGYTTSTAASSSAAPTTSTAASMRWAASS